jgi:hypothetical protein
MCVTPDVADDAAAFEALCGAIAASVAGHPSNQNTIARFQTSSEKGVDGTAGASATIAKLVRLVTAHTGGGGGSGGGPFGGVEHGEAGGSGSGGLGVPTVVSASDAAIRCLAACVQEHPMNQMVSNITPHARAHTPAPLTLRRMVTSQACIQLGGVDALLTWLEAQHPPSSLEGKGTIASY